MQGLRLLFLSDNTAKAFTTVSPTRKRGTGDQLSIGHAREKTSPPIPQGGDQTTRFDFAEVFTGQAHQAARTSLAFAGTLRFV
jgi:hypothetical protein